MKWKGEEIKQVADEILTVNVSREKIKIAVDSRTYKSLTYKLSII